MEETIDYQALCGKVIDENEHLRMKLLRFKNDEISFIDRFKEKIADIVESDRFLIYFYIGITIFTLLILPLIRMLFAFILGFRSTN